RCCFLRVLVNAHHFSQNDFSVRDRTLSLSQSCMFACLGLRPFTTLPLLLVQVKDQIHPARGQGLPRDFFAVCTQSPANEAERSLGATRHSHREPPSLERVSGRPPGA